jgi:hypothetical protein
MMKMTCQKRWDKKENTNQPIRLGREQTYKTPQLKVGFDQILQIVGIVKHDELTAITMIIPHHAYQQQLAVAPRNHQCPDQVQSRFLPFFLICPSPLLPQPPRQYGFPHR